VARLFAEPFENKYGRFTSVIAEPRPGAVTKIAMYFGALDEKYFATTTDPELEGFGPIPAGPNGVQGNELNATMTGIYAGLENDPVRREAAWNYIWFYDGPEARKIRAEVYVESGAGRYLSSKLLKEAGYPEYIRQIPKGWEAAQAKAVETGVPEPYGRNCQQVYRFLSEAVDQIRTDAETTAAIQSHDVERAKTRIRQILKTRVASSNEKMLNIITPEQRTFRNRVASLVGILILIAFAYTFYTVFKAFGRNQIAAVPEARPAPPPGWSGFPQRIFFQYLGMGRAHREHPVHASRRGHWQIDRYKWAYLVLLPALGSILLWAYYPLARGTVMAFQDYNVRGFSTWVGMDNFANVLFDAEFWHAMWTSVKYAGLYLLFGFFTPIILAFLLTEVPRGKIFFRTLYYLPAVLSGAVVIFLWKGFYGRYGLINQFLNLFVSALNNIGYWLSQWLPLTGDPIAPFNKPWLDSPQFALFFCLLPTIWAGMGPGCLIYLAALKTVPDEFYEAAEIDGAGIWSKLRHVSIPGIRGLIAINFIGALIGTIHGGSEMVLAMTGGGPYTPYGATEVIGLHIFWQSFGYLRFGAATAMAWILGAMLIGFTVLQLKRLSRMEFRRAGPTAAAGAKD
jgi:multiple sugar transport system permease protein